MRKRDKRALRILQLEIGAGVGLTSDSWDWLERQRPVTLGVYRRDDVQDFPNSVKWWCYGCGQTQNGIYGSHEAKLCHGCWRTANRGAAA